MRVILQSGEVIGHGEAPDDTPNMDADFARIMLGLTCHEALPDGSKGRSVDPQWVRAGDNWLVGMHALNERNRTAEAEAWRAAFHPCEALRSRDPGAS